jgi:hypothetical protein
MQQPTIRTLRDPASHHVTVPSKSRRCGWLAAAHALALATTPALAPGRLWLASLPHIQLSAHRPPQLVRHAPPAAVVGASLECPRSSSSCRVWERCARMVPHIATNTMYAATCGLFSCPPEHSCKHAVSNHPAHQAILPAIRQHCFCTEHDVRPPHLCPALPVMSPCGQGTAQWRCGTAWVAPTAPLHPASATWGQAGSTCCMRQHTSSTQSCSFYAAHLVMRVSGTTRCVQWVDLTMNTMLLVWRVLQAMTSKSTSLTSSTTAQCDQTLMLVHAQ